MANPEHAVSPADDEANESGTSGDDAPAAVAETLDQESNLPGEQGPPPGDE